MRRLTRFEYNNTVRDLLGDTSQPANGFVAEGLAGGLDNNAEALTVSQLLYEQFLDTAEALAQRLVQDLPKLLAPCDSAKAGEDACASQLLARFGGRAFRRPLMPDETQLFQDIYRGGKAQFGFATGLRLMLATILQSPRFLYRVDFGEPAKAGEKVVRATSYEVASRLSYFLWGTMPDEELFQAAAQNRLQTREQVAAQVRRMLADSRAREGVGHFFAQWTELNEVDRIQKDTRAFKTWKPTLPALLRKETEAFFEHMMWEKGGTLTALFTAPVAWMNAELAAFYGVTGPKGTAFEPVQLDPQQRMGFLTQAGLLARLAKPDLHDPILRGKYVREHVLCDWLPAPPDGIPDLPDPTPNQTTRERFELHRRSPACSSCHQLIDELGLGFENYDGAGLWRTVENGKPVNASGTLVGTDVDGTFVGGVALARKLAGSRKVSDCMLMQWFRFAAGRTDRQEDACTIASLKERFAASGGNIPELVADLTQADFFLYRSLAE